MSEIITTNSQKNHKLFIRTIGKIRNIFDGKFHRHQKKISKPHEITHSEIFVFHVIRSDTLEDVRNKLKEEIEYHQDNELSSNMIIEAVNEWESHRSPDVVFDSNALPQGKDFSIAPTHWFVQLIDLQDTESWTDLYMELLRSSGKKKPNLKRLYPESLLKETCYQMPDGEIFPSQDALAAAGIDYSSAKQVTLGDLVGH